MLGLIPARGGSKGVPGKNIKLLAGKPLIQYTIEAAKKSNLLSKIVVSTDDNNIASICQNLGIEVPFLRPAELAQDSTPTLPVIQHVLNFLSDNGEEFDAVCLLQPTNPLRGDNDIDSCITLMQENDYDCVISVNKVPHEYNPHWVYFKSLDGLLKLSTGEETPIPRRQNLPEAWHREGSIYLTKTRVIQEQNSLFGKKVGGYELNQNVSINIDTLEDWEKAEEFFSNQTL